MLLTQTEVIYARGVKDLLCNPRYNASLDPTSAAFERRIFKLNDQLAARGSLVCPSHCICDNLQACGKPYVTNTSRRLKADDESSPFPVPTALPPHGWETVGQKLFIHGCKAEGLFNASELALAAKFALMTVEKGQGLKLPGFADDKMAAIAQQWKDERRRLALPEGWALFYINAHFDWPFFAIHEQMLEHPEWAVQANGAASGDPCLQHGDPSFPQPADGM